MWTIQAGASTILCSLVLSVCVYSSLRLYQARSLARRYQRLGLPVAPNHNFLFGHLLYLKSLLDALPPKAHYQYALGDLALNRFSKEGCYYIDSWPVTGLIMINISPRIAPQVLQAGKISLERPSLLPRFFKPIAGGRNLFDLGETEWRPWRAVFVKGFNTEHIASLVPGMVKETQAYCKILNRRATKGEMFSLDTTTLRFTMDLIGKTILNTSLDAQQGYNTLADCMLNQIRWHQANAQTNPFSYLNVVRWYVHWSNGRQMDRYIGSLLDARYGEIQAEMAQGRVSITKSVIDLILQAYATTSPSRNSNCLDSEFRTFAIRQIRLFIFVGHDSTSSTICYIFHLLSSNPDSLRNLRAELRSVFGSFSSSEIGAQILAQQHLLNQLPYATAVIKETLRLYPPASASREGQPGVSITNDAGQSCPTDGAFVLTLHTAMQRSPRYWTRPDEFLPERFLVPPGHELYPPKNAWRPFEKGPRNCMAEGLVMVELKIVLALVVGQFEFREAYEEFDRARADIKGKKTHGGERAYQVEEGAAHPVDGYPCRVFSLREDT